MVKIIYACFRDGTLLAKHYENTPIQIYWKFYHQKKKKKKKKKMKIFR